MKKHNIPTAHISLLKAREAVKRALIIGFILIGSGWISPVQAHNVVSDIYIEGNMIEGEVGFSNGSPAKKCTSSD